MLAFAPLTPQENYKHVQLFSPPRRSFRLLTCAALLCGYSPAIAQDAQTANDGETVSASPADTSASEARQQFEPAFFERFAPRSALDMVNQIPGFILQSGNDGRGLGQANENILINGERLSGKSDSARDQLGRIPADRVVRIELVDGITLDVPGLTGQVANIIVGSGGLSGQFTWEGGFRTTAVDPEWYGGEVSLSGNSGALRYTLALENNNNRFGATGPIVITDADGTVIENTRNVFTGAFDYPRISANLGYDFGGDVLANLNLTAARTFFNRLESETRTLANGEILLRENRSGGGTPDYEISADIEFPFAGGQLKLIGLEAYDEDVSINTVIDRPLDSDTATGSRFRSDGGSGERIGRAEYRWKMLSGDWQLAGKAAFNRLDRVSRLFDLQADGSFAEIAFPGGTGGVREDRYEAILSFNRPLAKGLSLQASLGGEYSTLRQTGTAANSRSFRRPKGSVSLAWQPSNRFDISLELLREVGQLSFGDFLARVNLDNGNADAGNNELVPQQAWGVDLEINRSFGALGSTTLTFEQRWIEDYIDRIPLPGGVESRGNIDTARSTEIDWNTTLRLDGLGIAGGQLDIEAQLFNSRVRDPFDGRPRDFSRAVDRDLEVDFRHDIPQTPFAYGAGLNYSRRMPSLRQSEISLEYEGPTFVSMFVEHKDVLGLTLRASYANIFGGREREIRTVFDGPRTDGQIAFVENRNLRIGPIFRFSVSGSF